MSNIRNFVIEDGVLKKYTGQGGDIVIPDGVTTIGENAFKNCLGLKTVSMPDSVTSIENNAFYWCLILKEISLSKNLEFIGSAAFFGCKSLKEICIPETVTTLQSSAFASCNRLEKVNIPCGITEISGSLFENCAKLENIIFNENINVIASCAFRGCSSFSEITVPDGVTEIGSFAFGDCRSLKNIRLPEKICNFDLNSFDGCDDLVIELPESLAVNMETLSPACRNNYLCKYKIKTTDRGYAALALNLRGAGWQKWRSARTSENPSAEFAHMLDMLSGKKPFNTKAGKAIAEFVLKYYKDLSVENINKMLELFKGRKCKEIEELYDFRNLMEYIGKAKADDDPRVSEAMNIVEKFTLREDITAAVKKGVQWKSSKAFCPREVLSCIISYYADEWDRCKSIERGGISSVEVLSDGFEVKTNDDIDVLAEMLDKKKLSDALTALIKGVKYRLFLLSWARFADEKDIEEMTSQFKKLSRGKAKERYLASNLEQALLISETRAAMLFYDSIEKLKAYAAYRGVSVMEIRDVYMLPEFGFDSNGIKSYDIGGSTVEVAVTGDLKFRLYDSEKQKEIRSFPKKSNDPDKAALAAKDFAAFKKEVGNFIKLRSEQLCKMHLSGDSVSEELWRKVYLENPIIKHLSEHVIWQDESGVSFTVADGKTINLEKKEIKPKGNIHILHVLDMNQQEIDAWQQFLLAEKQTQLFEQVWEPVCQWNESDINQRYKGVTISSKERNTLKAKLKKRGVNVHSGSMDSEFDYYNYRYEFYGKNTMYLGKSMEIEYTVADDGSISFASAELNAHANKKEINAIVFELDKIAVNSHIRNDRAELLTEFLLAQFSVAQIVEFIDAANTVQATDCISCLMNYKNEHYPDYEHMNEFVLEW